MLAKHPEEQIAQLAGSIAEFRFTNPILVDSRVGSSPVTAAYSRPESSGSRHRAGPSFGDAKARLYSADNRLALSAGWNDELLRIEFEALAQAGMNLISSASRTKSWTALHSLCGP